MKSLLAMICILGMTGIMIGTIVEAGDTVTATVTPGNYSVSVDPIAADYGSMTLAATETSAQIAATNAGSLTEKINILGSDATYTEVAHCGDGTCTWTLSTVAPGQDTIVHAFTTKATPPATGATLGTNPLVEWVPLDKGANYTIASASVEAADIMNFYLDMRTPATAGTETDYGSEYSSTVTLQAVAP